MIVIIADQGHLQPVSPEKPPTVYARKGALRIALIKHVLSRLNRPVFENNYLKQYFLKMLTPPYEKWRARKRVSLRHLGSTLKTPGFRNCLTFVHPPR